MYIFSEYEFIFIKKIYQHKEMTVNDLINSLGFYPEKALEVLKLMLTKKYVNEYNDVITLTEEGRAAIFEYPFCKITKLNFDGITKQFKTAVTNMIDEHPLQYQYWFNETTCQSILEISVDFLQVKEPHLAFLGTPLLALYFNMVFPEWKLTVVDISESVINYIKTLVNSNVNFIITDMRYDSVQRDLDNYNIVFIDPPFYSDYYAGFLRWATAMQKEGELLFAVLFGSNIKDNMKERKMVTDLISSDYTLIKTYDDILKYLVPKFEKSTYKKWNNLSIKDWRRNTLGIFSKCKSIDDIGLCFAEDYEWKEYIFGKKRIMVRINNEYSKLDSFLFRSLYNDNDILKSVSRRNLDRNKICLWTSDNEVYIASNSALEVIHRVMQEYIDTGNLEKETIQYYKEKYGDLEVENLLYTVNKLIQGGFQDGEA